MKRHITLHALLAGALLLPAIAQNDAPPPPPPPPEAAQGENPPPPPGWNRGDRGERGPRRRRFNPDDPRFQDPRFQENLKRWQEMPPEQRQEMRQRFDGRRQRAREEVEKALSEAGITLTDEQKEAFFQRYREERRKIDQEMEELRRQKTDALRRKMIEELKSKPAS